MVVNYLFLYQNELFSDKSTSIFQLLNPNTTQQSQMQKRNKTIYDITQIYKYLHNNNIKL